MFGRVRVCELFQAVPSVLALIIVSHANAQRTEKGCPDTVIVIDEYLSFRASTCQDVSCLRDFHRISFDAFIRSDLENVSIGGDIGVSCRSYALPNVWRGCDSTLIFDPPLRIEVPLPAGLSAVATEEQMKLLQEDGLWTDVRKNVRLNIRETNGRRTAVFEVHRLVPRFSICCGGVIEGTIVRVRFRGEVTPSAAFISNGTGVLFSTLERRGAHRWKGEISCADAQHLLFAVPDGHGGRSWAEPALKDLRHRFHPFGKRCPPRWRRAVWRSYVVRSNDTGPLRPALLVE